MKEEIEDIVDLMEQAEDFRPIIQKGIEILKSYGPELDEIATLMCNALADKYWYFYNQLHQNGFTSEQAFTLLLNYKFTIGNNFDRKTK